MNFNTRFLVFLITVIGFSSCQKRTSIEDETAAKSEEPAVEDKKKEPIKSPRKQAKGTIGTTEIVVDYGSPAVRNREGDIWGELEPYDKIWRAGANETTSIEFSSDVKFGDTPISAGKYGFFLLLKENEDWIAILNTDWNREEHGAWGAYNYTLDHDVARVAVIPLKVDDNQERLEYTVTENGITLAWEKIRVSIPISVSE